MNNYRYDLHVHTKETSSCGWIPAAELVQLYHEQGYTGVAVTDHMHEKFVESLDNPGDWSACVDAFLAGWRAAKARGDALGMDVILGMELRTPVNDNDYLVYGIDEDFLLRHPYIYRTTLAEFAASFGDELLIIQAHPYRGGGVDLQPQLLHGIEIVNCNPRHDNHNDLAVKLAAKHPHLLRICSSDAHRPGDPCRAATLFPHRVPDSVACRNSLRADDFTLECAEFQQLLQKAAAQSRSHKRRKHHVPKTL